ncbi:MAG: GAF domain-containing protein [Proteobacteria bacterium]|nr:GAF domain-containing protein [Pseudomonadota bacterium]
MSSHLAASNSERPWSRAVRSLAAFAQGLRNFVGYARHVGESPAIGSRARSGGFASFNDFTQLMQTCANYEDAFGMVRRRAAATFAEFSGALYYMAQNAGGKLELKAAWGKDTACGECLEAADCRVMRTGEAQLAAADMACASRRQSMRARSLCMPLKAHGEVIGVLMLQEGAAAGRLESSRALALGFSDQVGLALANMRMRDALRRLSGHDPLAESNDSRKQPEVYEPART